MILYIENPKDSTKKLLELINEFSKVAVYKINVQKSVVFLHTNNEAAESEIKKTIPYTTVPKTLRYLGINLSKEVKDLYCENHKTLIKEIQEDTKTSHAHGLEEQILLKCLNYPKQSTGLMQSP